jgi:hypothetical protein
MNLVYLRSYNWRGRGLKLLFYRKIKIFAWFDESLNENYKNKLILQVIFRLNK